MGRLPPKIEEWLDNYNRLMADLLAQGFEPTPELTRKGLADLTRSLVIHCPDIAFIRDDNIRAQHHLIPIRIYHPAPDSNLPVLLYFHGGGHMAGSIAVYDPICRKLAAATQHVIVSVEYRLAPEHPYPAGVEDAYSVAESVWGALDRNQVRHQTRLSIAGDSAGGALCATVAHKAQHDPGITIQHQILIYPSLDYTMASPSIDIYGKGYLLEKSKIQWYFNHYFQNNEDRRKASPLFMKTTPNLPETMVITAGFDPLSDEGNAYVEKIRDAGGRVRHLHFDDMIHAFINLETVAEAACDTFYREINAFLHAQPHCATMG